MTSSLDHLKAHGTTVVADTGDFTLIGKYKPQDSTTNPSLILAAASKSEFAPLIDQAVAYAGHVSTLEEQVDEAFDNLLVQIGKRILEIIPGRVSTEVDARFSFDTKATIQHALRIIKMYEKEGISKDRVLIKIASTWEGIQAARILQSQHGVNCNLTLLFSLVQAIAAAEAGVFLISPFVGRILDWYKKSTGKSYSPAEDPGVLSVKEIFEHYKSVGFKTIVMGASFRNVGEILELAGVDYLTISPSLLEELSTSTDKVELKLDASAVVSKLSAEEIANKKKVTYIDDESSFRLKMNEDPMATEKLREGICKFAEDSQQLHELLKKKLQSKGA